MTIRFYNSPAGKAVMLRRLCGVLVVGALFGCAGTREILLSPQMNDAPLRQVNRETRNRAVQLLLRDGRLFLAQSVRVHPDSTFWHAVDSEVAWAVKTAEISRISFFNRKKGLVNGLIISTLIGLTSGALIIDSPSGISSALSGALSFAPWGAGIGALVGCTVTYVFVPTRAAQPPPGEP